MTAFDKEFQDQPDEIIFQTILAANFLDIKNLLELMCKKVADEIKKRTKMISMTFVDFLEAVARLSELVSPPSPERLEAGVVSLFTPPPQLNAP